MAAPAQVFWHPFNGTYKLSKYIHTCQSFWGNVDAAAYKVFD